MAYRRILGLLIIVSVMGTLAISAPVAADTNLPIGGQGQIVNTDGDGVRVREEPSAVSDTLKVLAEGWRVTVLAGPVSGEGAAAWYRINHTGTNGYVAADYLTTATGATGGLTAGEAAQVVTDDGTTLRLREEPGGRVLLTMPNGVQVPVLAGPTTDGSNQRWYQVIYEGQKGWALGAYLRPAAQVVAQRETTSRSASRPVPEPRRGGSGGGAAIAALGQEYVGTPYAWGGASPAGFDCSGFVRYVVRRSVGIELGRDVFAQVTAGVPVDFGDVEPGDLVFFKNTYRWGLSHVGIYIGGGRMVNAQSESTGVKVQSIRDAYWGPRLYAVRRLVT